MIIKSIFKAVDSILASCMRPLVIVLSLLVAGLLALGIFSRILIGSPMFGLEELVLISVMWLYLIGSGLAAKDRAHLSADFVNVITNNEKIRVSARLVSSLVSLVMAVCFVLWSYDLFVWGIAKNQTTPVFHIPWYISQGSFLLGGFIFVFYLLRDTVKDFMELLGKEVTDQTEDTEQIEITEQIEEGC